MCVLVCVQQTATDTNGIPRIPVAGRTAGSLSVCCLLTGRKGSNERNRSFSSRSLMAIYCLELQNASHTASAVSIF